MSLSVSPSLGDVLVLVVTNQYGGFSPNVGVSGGGVTTWHQFNTALALTGNVPNTVNVNAGVYLFWGVVTSGGPSTVLLNGGAGGSYGGIVQGFTPSITPSEDTVYGSDSAIAGSGNYDAVTPTGPGELYVAGFYSDYAGTPGGSSAGFTYVDFDAVFIGGMQLVYKLSATGSQAPAWSLGSSSEYATFAAFLSPGVGTMRVLAVL